MHGLSQTPTSSDTPQTNWTRRRFANSSGTVQVEAYSIQGAGHSLPSSGMAAAAIAFFGLTTAPTTPPVTTPPSSGSCRITATITAWNSGLVENLTVTNTSDTTINGWSLVFTLPSGQTITSGWNATYSPTSGQVMARNMSYNAAIPANGSVSIGFQANHAGNAAKPTSFTLNGATCAVA